MTIREDTVEGEWTDYYVKGQRGKVWHRNNTGGSDTICGRRLDAANFTVTIVRPPHVCSYCDMRAKR